MEHSDTRLEIIKKLQFNRSTPQYISFNNLPVLHLYILHSLEQPVQYEFHT